MRTIVRTRKWTVALHGLWSRLRDDERWLSPSMFSKIDRAHIDSAGQRGAKFVKTRRSPGRGHSAVLGVSFKRDKMSVVACARRLAPHSRAAH